MPAEVYSFAEFRLDIVERRVFRNGTPLQLPPKIFDILKLLVQRSGRIVTKKEIIKRVWPEIFVEENNLTVRMSQLRKALSDCAERRLIETVPGSGYRFVARVREEQKSGSDRPADSYRSLAVLPFAVAGNQQKLGYISEGVVETLVKDISRLPHMKVMAPSTVSRYSSERSDPQAAGQDLGVEVVLIGRLKKVNDNLMIGVELIDVSDGSYIWGASYRVALSDLFKLQNEIVADLSASLRLKFSEGERARLSRRQTWDSEAYHHYLKGRYFYNNKRSVQGIQKAIAYFTRAIARDRNSALGYSGLADCYTMLSSIGWAAPKKMMPKAKAAAIKALKIDPTLPEAHVSLAGILANYEWDWEGAKKEYDLARRLNPSGAHTLQMHANYLAKVGQAEQGIESVKRARAIEPWSLSLSLALGRHYYLARRYNAAIKQCQETLEMDPGYGSANGVLGAIYLQRNLYDQAASEFKKLIAFSAGSYEAPVKEKRRQKIVFSGADPEAVGSLGLAYALAGKTGPARRILHVLMDVSKVRYVEPHTVALVYMGLGDKDSAFEWLGRAYRDRCTTLTYLKVWPILEPLRSDPRYSAMVRSMGLQP